MSERKKIIDSAWRYMSKYIRLKECFETTNTYEYGKCCDCGKVYSIEFLDAGHLVPGRSYAELVMFTEENVHIQCHSCNRKKLTGKNSKEGMSPRYYLYMVNKYGQDRVTELVRMKFQPSGYTLSDLEDIRDYYKQKLKELDI